MSGVWRAETGLSAGASKPSHHLVSRVRLPTVAFRAKANRAGRSRGTRSGRISSGTIPTMPIVPWGSQSYTARLKASNTLRGHRHEQLLPCAVFLAPVGICNVSFRGRCEGARRARLGMRESGIEHRCRKGPLPKSPPLTAGTSQALTAARPSRNDCHSRQPARQYYHSRFPRVPCEPGWLGGGVHSDTYHHLSPISAKLLIHLLICPPRPGHQGGWEAPCTRLQRSSVHHQGAFNVQVRIIKGPSTFKCPSSRGLQRSRRMIKGAGHCGGLVRLPLTVPRFISCIC